MVIAALQSSLGICTQRFDMWYIRADRFFRDLLVASVLDSGTGTILDIFWARRYGESGYYSRDVDDTLTCGSRVDTMSALFDREPSIFHLTYHALSAINSLT